MGERLGVFMWDDHNAGGGWNDCEGIFYSRTEARNAVQKGFERGYNNDYLQVINLVTGEKVFDCTTEEALHSEGW